MAVSARREARIDISANADKMDAGVNGARRKLRSLGKDAEKGFSFKEASVGAARQIGAKVTNGITALVQNAVTEVLDLDRAMTRLQVTGEMSSKEIAGFHEELRRASLATGVGEKDLLAGGIALVNFTGHAENARQALELMGKVQRATGASTHDIAGIFATFDKNMNLPVDQWQGAMDVLIKQGHIGGIEMSDLAGSFTAVAAASATLFKGGATVRGISEASAMAQVLNDSTHDAAETATQMKAMYTEFRKPGSVKRLRAIGIEPFDKATGEIKPMIDLLDELKKKNLSVEKTSNIFRDIRGNAAVSFLQKHIDKVHELVDASKESNQTNIDSTATMESASGRVDTAMNKMKVAIAEAFTPERIAAFAIAIEGLADKVAPLATMLGGIVDAFNGLANVGKSVRGAISGNGNPYAGYGTKWNEGGKAESHQFSMIEASQRGDKQGFNDHLRAIVSGSHNYDAYNTAVDSILGGEQNDRSTPESIKRAVLAAHTNKAFDEGAGGESAAGNLYLKNAGIDKAKSDELLAGYQGAAMDKIVKAIQDGFARTQTTVKVGAEPVVKAHGNAMDHRRQPGGR